MAIKKKQNYIDLFEKMIKHYSKDENRDMFDYKRYFFSKGFTLTGIKMMCIKYPDVKNLYIDLKHIIIATLTRMILENKINKDVFAVRTMKLMFKDLTYHTPEEIAQIEKLQAERDLDSASAQKVTINFNKKSDEQDD